MLDIKVKPQTFYSHCHLPSGKYNIEHSTTMITVKYEFKNGTSLLYYMRNGYEMIVEIRNIT